MKLSPYGRAEWLTILAVGVMLAAAAALASWWWIALLTLLLAAALVAFFRDPDRIIPAQRHVVVSPADGRVSSVHEVEHHELLGESAVCVRVFLSVLDVHVCRSPCHGIVSTITHRPGLKINALNPRSAEQNEAATFLLLHPVRKKPVAVVRQIAGMLARTIVCAVKEGTILQRGQRFGIIKFGSTAEVYIPRSLAPRVTVQKGQRVVGGVTVVAAIASGMEKH